MDAHPPRSPALRLPGPFVRRHAPAARAIQAAWWLACGLSTTACVVVPQTREVYDSRCKVLTKEVVLETAVLGQFQSCGGRECQVLLVSMGLVTAASAVISGSVAVVGNVVYWFERQGRCPGSSGAKEPVVPAVPAVPMDSREPAVPVVSPVN
jgi:hypothetical protein